MIDHIVSLITSSIIMFSSIGIFILTLNARYTQATGRVREVHEHLDVCPKKQKELSLLITRCWLLKYRFLTLICSSLCSSGFVLYNISSFYRSVNSDVLVMLLVGTMLFIFVSMLFLCLDVLVSFKATLIHIDKL